MEKDEETIFTISKYINLISNQCLAIQKERTKNLLLQNDEDSKRFFAIEEKWKKI